MTDTARLAPPSSPLLLTSLCPPTQYPYVLCPSRMHSLVSDPSWLCEDDNPKSLFRCEKAVAR